MASNVRKASGEAPGAPAAKITPTAVIIILNTSEWLQPSHHISRADYTDSHSNSSNGNISKRAIAEHEQQIQQFCYLQSTYVTNTLINFLCCLRLSLRVSSHDTLERS